MKNMHEKLRKFGVRLWQLLPGNGDTDDTEQDLKFFMRVQMLRRQQRAITRRMIRTELAEFDDDMERRMFDDGR